MPPLPTSATGAPGDASATDDPLSAALQRHFGFGTFQIGQRAVIEDVLSGRPTMAVMPTGAGKSLCYQLPALLLGGVTVVVSPLIALMKDQVDGLRARGVDADFVNSSQSDSEQRAALDRMKAGQTRLMYVAPERFRSGAFRRALREVPLSLFAVDEAHCISRWGHDFRPDYTRLGEVVDELRPARLLACTATATSEVRTDILRALHCESAATHIAGFLRENLFLEARLCQGDRDRDKRVARFLASEVAREGSIIIYASTRKRVERYAEVVAAAVGPKQVVAYHGGMSDSERTQSQDRFMSGRARVAVATNAFGMGVDRGDVRAVIHVDLPRTVEGYYQEVGRAGRDRKPAHCLLLYNPTDTRVHEFLIDQSHPAPEAFAAIWRALRGAHPELGITAPVIEANMRDAGFDGMVEPVLRQLARIDAVQNDGFGNLRATPGAPADPNELGIDFDRIAEHREHEYDKLGLMRRFIHNPGCRHAYVLDYFGEGLHAACPGCDRCAGDGLGGVPGIELGDPSPEEALIIRKALAGAARAEGRFGLRKVAGMLAGQATKSTDEAVSRLSTFGVLRPLTADKCAELLQILVDQRLCEITTGRYPLLRISADGWEVMQGRKGAGFKPPAHLVPGALPARRAKMLREGQHTLASRGAKASATAPSTRVASTPGVEAAEDAEAVSLLRAFRQRLAHERSKPAFVIFSDRTLHALANMRPRDEGEFLAVPGLGPGKWADFGADVITLLND